MRKFSIKYSSIPIFEALYAVNNTSPAQLPLVSGYQKSGVQGGYISITKMLQGAYRYRVVTGYLQDVSLVAPDCPAAVPPSSWPLTACSTRA